MSDRLAGPLQVSSAGWWRPQPWWAGCAASIWAVLYGCALLAGAFAGHSSAVGLPHAAWPAAAVLVAGGALAAATIGPWGRRLPVRAVSGGVWGAAVLSLAASCFVLLNMIELVLTGSVSDRQGNSDWLSFVQRLGFVLAGALFVVSAVGWRRRTAAVCVRCGLVHTREETGLEYPAPQAASRRIRWIAYTGAAAFLPYFSLHTLGVFGYSGFEELYENGRPPWYVLLLLLCGIGLAVFLLLGLVRPWGMAFPRGRWPWEARPHWPSVDTAGRCPWPP